MPTPVATARQCLTTEAAEALDEAVTVAKRRGHNQTTSLHAVSALLTISTSILRDAIIRARNNAYSPRLQFKALELCLSVSLERVPASSSSSDIDPPVSNSLMAAIKRSQANQRRQPECFHLYNQMYQQQQQNSTTSSISCVKVELRNFVLSILDDPVVSRVFGESGFRSSEIKFAILRPLPQVFKFSRSKGPPMFLCNLSENSDPGMGKRSFGFPFSGGCINGDENCRRIGDVLGRNKARNPLLVGVCAYDTLKSFSELIDKRKESSFLPNELCGLSLISIENDVAKFLNENSDKGCVDLKFNELVRFVEQSLGPGLVLNLGDLKVFNENSSDLVSYIVDKLTKFFELYSRKVWYIGSTASYEGYLKFIGRFCSVEKDWDLQLLPITTFRTSMSESHPRSSLMESFVPFAGFFSTPSELNSSSNSSHQWASRCHLCDDKCEQEIFAASKGGTIASVADQYQSSLPSWLQMKELDTNKDEKTGDDGAVLSAKIAAVRKKWDGICQHIHPPQTPGSNTHPSRFPTVVGFHVVENKKDDAEKCSSHSTNPSLDGSQSLNLSIDLSRNQPDLPPSVPSAVNNESVKQWEKSLKDEDHQSGGLRSHCFSNSSVVDGSQASPSSATSVTTDLGLRISPVAASKEPNKFADKHHMQLSRDLSGFFSANADVVNGSISNHLAHSSSSSSLDYGGQFEPNSFKMLFRSLTEKVNWQDEAVHVISQTIARCRTRNERRQDSCLRRDIWFNFLGPDKCGKKKIAAALAEIIFGSSKHLISADLNSQNGLVDMNNKEGHAYDLMFRGKTVIDYVAGELGKKPLAVVYLENVDKADVQAQNSLSHAIGTGKFLDSHGREVGINNAIFVTTSTFSDEKNLFSTIGLSTYSEERILGTKSRPMQILIESASVTPGSFVVNKRKLAGANQSLEQHCTSDVIKRANKSCGKFLDLNLPAEENDALVINDGSSDNDSMSSNSKAWLQDFLNQLDRIVVFKPFDFTALSKRILTETNNSFHSIVGSDHLLDIDSKVMEQLLAASYLSTPKAVVDDWMKQVLSKAFMEVTKRYNLNAHSTIKLVAHEGLLADEHSAGVYLPSKIILN